MVASAWMAVCGLAIAPASAQSLSRVSLDSVSAIDLFKGEGTTGQPDASIDISSVIRIGRGWSAHIRPWFFKSSSDGSEWSKEIYQAAMRYERPGPVAVRADAGYIASPIGLGMFDMRADANPTIQGHLSYFVPMLAFDRNAPGMSAIAASYPLGANATASTARWDVRAAVVSAAPTRRFALNANAPNPALTPVVIVGGGVTPRTGLRIGIARASGRYATGEELRTADGVDRMLTMWTVEGDYAFGYTKLSAEWTREAFVRGAARDTAFTWFVQGMQTLTPRWFAGARHERIDAPPFAAGPGSPRLSFPVSEGTIGYRLSPELTVRGSVTASRWYTATKADRRVGVQLVWSRRWW
jgi:hypothetical protein